MQKQSDDSTNIPAWFRKQNMGQKKPANISVFISFLTEGGHRLKRFLTVKSGPKKSKTCPMENECASNYMAG